MCRLTLDPAARFTGYTLEINISMSDFTRVDNIEAVTQSIKQRIREFKLRYRELYEPTVEETVECESLKIIAKMNRFSE